MHPASSRISRLQVHARTNVKLLLPMVALAGLAFAQKEIGIGFALFPGAASIKGVRASTNLKTEPVRVEPNEKARFMDPRDITRELGKCSSASQLLRVFEAAVAEPFLNEIHLSTVMVRLAKTAHSLSREVQSSPSYADVFARVQAGITSGAFDSRQISNILWALTTLVPQAPQARSLVPVVLKSLSSRIEGMTAQGVANTMWCCGKLELNARDLAPFMPQLLNRVSDLADDFEVQGLVNIFWAAARLQDSSPEVADILGVLALRAQKKLDSFSVRSLADTMYAAAVLQDVPPAFEELVRKSAIIVGQRYAQLNSQSLPTAMWAIAALRTRMPELKAQLAVLATAAPAVAPSLTSQGVANCIWSIGISNIVLDARQEFFSTLLRRATMQLRSFTLQGLANTCEGLALQGWVDEGFMKAVSDHLVQGALVWESVDDIIAAPTFVWAYARLNVPGDDVIALMSARLLPNMHRLSKPALCVIAWSCGAMGNTAIAATLGQAARNEAGRRKVTDEQIAYGEVGFRKWTTKYQ